MKSNDSKKDLHLELLEEYNGMLTSDGSFFNESDRVQYNEEIVIGYRDEGPDAWAGSVRFNGPAWLWTKDEGWEFYENGVTITGYAGLLATVLNIEEDGLHITNVYGG